MFVFEKSNIIFKFPTYFERFYLIHFTLKLQFQFNIFH